MPVGRMAAGSILGSADLPDLSGARALLLGAGPEDIVALAKCEGAEVIEAECLGQMDEEEQGGLQLVYLAPGSEAEAHPISTFAALWHLVELGGTLVVGAPILTDPQLSQEARPLPASGGASRIRWLLGRLALRWMVETSGFDFKEWISDPDWPRPGAEPDTAYLRATRVARQPALDLARPSATRDAG